MSQERTFASIPILIDKACSGMANERKIYHEIQQRVYSATVNFTLFLFLFLCLEIFTLVLIDENVIDFMHKNK